MSSRNETTNRRILFSRVFFMSWIDYWLSISFSYDFFYTPESRLHLNYCNTTKEILWSKIGYWYMSTWQILTPSTFPLKKRTGEWSQNGEKAVLSPSYNTRWQLRRAAARCGGAPRFSASNDRRGRGGRGGRRFSCWKCVSQPTFLWPGNPVTQFLIMLLSEP